MRLGSKSGPRCMLRRIKVPELTMSLERCVFRFQRALSSIQSSIGFAQPGGDVEMEAPAAAEASNQLPAEIEEIVSTTHARYDPFLVCRLSRVPHLLTATCQLPV